MAKRTKKVTYKGLYNHALGTITESTKEGDYSYDIMTTLEEFDGALISFSVNEDTQPNPIGYGDDEDSDEDESDSDY